MHRDRDRGTNMHVYIQHVWHVYPHTIAGAYIHAGSVQDKLRLYILAYMNACFQLNTHAAACMHAWK